MSPFGRRLAAAARSALSPDIVAVQLALLALVATTAARLVISRGQPLWLDETWTGAIAIQDSWAGFWRQVRLDANGPLYYVAVALWTRVFGLSDVALRFPSFVFGALAPIALMLAPVRGLSASARMTWSALVALWVPGLWFSGEARCYALVLLVATLQVLAFVRLLQGPNLARAAIWCAVSSLVILSHYHAGILTAVQGLVYLALGRRRAVRTWPAALIFLPAAAWTVSHLPRIAEFARPEVAWYAPLGPDDSRRILVFLLGVPPLLLTLPALALVSLLLGLATRRRAIGPSSEWDTSGLVTGLWATVAAALIAMAVTIGIGVLRPTFVERYLTAFMPSLLLGIVLLSGLLARRWAWSFAALILVFAGGTVPWVLQEIRAGWRYYNWEVASDLAMVGGAERLVFFWDHPSNPVLAADQRQFIGTFFFQRAGRRVEFRPIVAAPGVDPNPLILAEARAPNTAIVWAYDVGVRRTAARFHPPRLAELDPSLKCRNFGGGAIGVVACDRTGALLQDLAWRNH